MQVVWLEQHMFCCCDYEATTTVVTALCSCYFLRRKMVLAALREKRLWPPTSGRWDLAPSVLLLLGNRKMASRWSASAWTHCKCYPTNASWQLP